MKYISSRYLLRYFTPLTFFTLAIILSFKLSFQGQYIHDFFLKSIIDESVTILSESSKLSIKGIALSNSEIKLHDTSIGTIENIKITPKIAQLFSGQVSKIKASTGDIIINKTTLPAILGSQGINLPLDKITLNRISVDCFGTLFTMKSQDSGWAILNTEKESLSLTPSGKNISITSPIFSIPYVTLANIKGILTADDKLSLSGNISPLKSQFNLDIQRKANLIELSGALQNDKIEMGKLSGAYNTDKQAYTFKANIKEIPFRLFDTIFKNEFNLPIMFKESGLIGINYDVSHGLLQEIKSFVLNLTNLKASLFLYDFYGISGTISLDDKSDLHNFNISIDSIHRNKLKFMNTVVLLQRNEFYGAFPTLINTEFCKGALRLHDFKVTEDGLEASVEIQDLDINEVIANSTITSLAATGKLSGAARVLLTPEKVIILKAKLNTSSSKGKIHYFPKLEGLDDQKSSQALENLDYTILNIDIESTDIAEPGNLQIQIVGTNPVLSNGYPLDFNIETKATLMDFFS